MVATPAIAAIPPFDSPSTPPADPIPLLPESVPVAMPELPPRLLLSSEEQLKAIGDPTRSRILAIIQHQPATAKQIAVRLGIPPGTIGHHLAVLERSGLAQLVARRQVRGTVAKYYARTARLYLFDFPHAGQHGIYPSLDMLSDARAELCDALALNAPEAPCGVSFPHARLSAARAAEFQARLSELVNAFIDEPADPNGQVYGFVSGLFLAPPYLQVTPAEPTVSSPANGTHQRLELRAP
ncbi:MAG TPA: winged helix-turn-helix domain-containing protein [Ktedonobacterales bacterium]|nr:winged helix-turn-helix domain-containing protein [Ktedonobacterales bacterium]